MYFGVEIKYVGGILKNYVPSNNAMPLSIQFYLDFLLFCYFFRYLNAISHHHSAQNLVVNALAHKTNSISKPEYIQKKIVIKNTTSKVLPGHRDNQAS